MPYFVLIPYAVLLCIYLIFEQKKNFVVATTLKLSLSAAFCAAAFFAAMSVNNTGVSEYIPAYIISGGLCFAFAGDYFLQYIKLDNEKFKKGIILFAAAQVMLIVAYYIILPVHFLEFVFLAAFLVLAVLLMKKQQWDISAQSPHITVYTVLVAFMGAKALSFAFLCPELWQIALGGALFFLSDIILGMWNYKSGKMYLAHLNWITYFIGEIFIALGVWALMLAAAN